MASRLLSNHGETFNEHFPDCWLRTGLSDRPGELVEDDRNVLHSYYFKLIKIVKLNLTKIYVSDPKIFFEGVKKLCGFSSDLVKVVYAYKDKGSDARDKCFVETWKNDEDYNFEDSDLFEEFNKSKSSLKLKLGNKIIEFRIKPMNKFTTPGVKINVSVKYNY